MVKWKLYIYQLKKRHKPLFLGGREHLTMHRSGQGPFLPHTKQKQNEQTSVGYFLFCIAGI
ncbi:hypothetical protein CON65_13560 [Bacillus pseudomycoides]|uniref:Uncharacterized protein n=1 Tax=Bacillus pseudomycoides TaxID=64104 RepID=A0AA91VBF5_9BACI|nr:hypothetical protein COO03_00665 [Bacillus sp. AFS098217]PED82048.1 hypothetical protein CON65_13560 [Bacillus pseudomycoides]